MVYIFLLWLLRKNTGVNTFWLNALGISETVKRAHLANGPPWPQFYHNKEATVTVMCFCSEGMWLLNHNWSKIFDDEKWLLMHAELEWSWHARWQLILKKMIEITFSIRLFSYVIITCKYRAFIFHFGCRCCCNFLVFKINTQLYCQQMLGEKKRLLVKN